MGSRPQFIFRLNKQKYQSYFQNEMTFQCLVASGRIGYIYLSWSYLFLRGVDSILPFAWITYISRQVNVLRCVLYASLFLDEMASISPLFLVQYAFYFQTKWFYFQKDTRSPGPIFSPSLVSIYSRSYIILFLVHMCALYIVSLNGLFLEQYPAIFSSIFGLSSTKALTRVYFQSNISYFQSIISFIFSPLRFLFLVPYLFLGAIFRFQFDLVYIESKLIFAFGWIRNVYFI